MHDMLDAIPFRLLAAYWGSNIVGHFPMETRAMIDDLILLKPEFGRTQNLLDKLQVVARPNAGSGKSGGRNGSD